MNLPKTQSLDSNLELEYDNICTRIFFKNGKMKKVQHHLDIIHKYGQKILTLDNFYIKVTFNLENLEFITYLLTYLRLCQIYKSPYHCQWLFRITLENFMPPLVMCIVCSALPLLISTGFLKYPFRHLFHTWLKIQY